MKKRNAFKSKKGARRSEKSRRRTAQRANSYSKRELKLSREIEDDLFQLILDEELENELNENREIEKRARSSDRKNADDLTEKSEKHSKRKIFTKDHNIYSISDNTSRSVIEFKIKLAKRHHWDLLEMINQNDDKLYEMLWPYFLPLLKKVRKKSQHFRVVIGWKDENGTLDRVSTSLHDFDDIPDVVKKRLRYLISLIIRKASEYKKHYTSFFLYQVELWRYDELPKKQKRK